MVYDEEDAKQFYNRIRMENSAVINKILYQFILMFGMVSVITTILVWSGILHSNILFGIHCIGLYLVAALSVWIMRRHHVSVNAIRYFVLISLALIMGFIGAFSDYGIAMGYILIPILSCAYISKTFTKRILMICYFVMITALFFRTVLVLGAEGIFVGKESFLENAILYTFEYFLLYAIIQLILSRVDVLLEQILSSRQNVAKMQRASIHSFAELIESRDNSTGQHVKKTGELVETIVHAMLEKGMYSDIVTAEYLDEICLAASLHDIGKIKIPDAILTKQGRLTSEEFEIIKTHTTAGYQILQNVLSDIEDESLIRLASNVARSHHERWDGLGYPDRIAGTQIPFCARIMAVADVFDALVSKRCYKEPYSFEKSFEIIEDGAGKQFDAEIVSVFLENRSNVEKIYQ